MCANVHGKWSNQSSKVCFQLHEKEETFYTLFKLFRVFNLKIIDNY